MSGRCQGALMGGFLALAASAWLALVKAGRLVVNVALDDITRRGPLSQALEQTYALGRRTG